MTGITRRDFIDGVACAVVAGMSPGAGATGVATPGVATPGVATPGVVTPGTYPASLTGLRGSRDADLAVAHALRDGRRFRVADHAVSEEVDCVIVGAGIGGLSAAHF